NPLLAKQVRYQLRQGPLRGGWSAALDGVRRLGPEGLLGLALVELLLGEHRAGGDEGNEQQLLHVGLTGLEPVTSSLSGKRSNRLSYRPGGTSAAADGPR